MDAQATGPVTIDTPLGGAATFRSMSGVEALSRLFVYDLEIVSDRADVDAVVSQFSVARDFMRRFARRKESTPPSLSRRAMRPTVDVSLPLEAPNHCRR